MSRVRRGIRALPKRVAYENRHPQHVRGTEHGVIWLDRETMMLVGAYCNDCAPLAWRTPEGEIFQTPNVLDSAWIVKRYRAKYIGPFVQDKLAQRDLELLVFLKLVADQHRWETGHYTWVTTDPSGLLV